MKTITTTSMKTSCSCTPINYIFYYRIASFLWCFDTLMELIFASSKILHFARTYFREWAVLQFLARIYFCCKSAMLRIFVNTNYWDILRVLIFANRLFSVFRGYLFSRIGLPQTFREDLISRIWPKFAKINPIKVFFPLMFWCSFLWCFDVLK